LALIKSVSGIRGTIGGNPGENLTPLDIVAFVSAYGHFIQADTSRPRVVIGRDGRISGLMVKQLAMNTLLAMGIDVVDLDLSTTPTVEMYVKSSGANGGIIITASHNPAEWNALKFLNHLGEFISPELGAQIQELAEKGAQSVGFAGVHHLGQLTFVPDAIQHHIQAILAHPLIDPEVIREAGFIAVVDAINSTGSISVVPLLKALGVHVHTLNDDLSGQFAHNPEPLPEHLHDLCQAVVDHRAHLGISVDPDVDRLALVDERGIFFGEEYTLVCAADYVLQHQKGPVVTNLSSSMALKDLAASYNVPCYFAPVGEVHVVAAMKEKSAVFGGEGNGGIIDPQLHYGRDALIGIALVLMHMATSGKKLSELKATYSAYVMIKDKMVFDPARSAAELLKKVAMEFQEYSLDRQDGLKISLADRWVQLRKSNTEPILRIYAEGKNMDEAAALVSQVKAILESEG
jgi:phosphomannomutase